MEEQRPFRPGCAPVLAIDLWVNMAVHNEEIEPTIVVIVEKGCTPTEKGDGDLGNTCLVGDICEIGITIVTVERVVVIGEGCVVEIEKTVVGVVPDGDTHAGGLTAALIQCIA